MPLEIEIKVRVEDVNAFLGILRRMGARKIAGVGRVHEWNAVFDTSRNDLKKREQLLRIRVETPEKARSKAAGIQAQPTILTWKSPVPGHKQKTRAGRHKIREELELHVSDGEMLCRIFQSLGMRVRAHYEKFRTTFRMPKSMCWAKGLLIELDETPMGTFVELEGPEKAIDRAAKRLGFSKDDYITENYLRLFADHCRRRGVKAGDMVFQKGG